MPHPKIITGEDNPLLRRKAVPIKKIDAKTQSIIKGMEKILAFEKGLGLAAPQIGENIRLILVKLNPNTSQEMVLAMINPEITAVSKEQEIAEEGCLSLPGRYGQVARAKEITVKFDIINNSQKQILKLSFLNAKIVQHEVDHLDGILFVDKLVKEPVAASKAEKISF